MASNPEILYRAAEASKAEIFRFSAGDYEMVIRSFSLPPEPKRHYAFLFERGGTLPISCFVYEASSEGPPFFGGYSADDTIHRNYGNAPMDLSLERFAKRAVSHTARQLGLKTVDFHGDERLWSNPASARTRATEPRSELAAPSENDPAERRISDGTEGSQITKPDKRRWWRFW